MSPAERRLNIALRALLESGAIGQEAVELVLEHPERTEDIVVAAQRLIRQRSSNA